MTTRLEQAKNFLAKVLTKREGAEEGGLESLTPEVTPNFEHLELPRGDQALAQRTFSKVTQGAALSESEQFALEAIIIPDKRPAVDIVKGDYRIVHPDWQSFEEVATKSTIKGTFSSIGRIEVIGFPGLPYGGTGFVVGDNLVMTNRHVAGLFANGVGRDGLMFMPGRASKVDFEYDPDSDQKQLLGVRSVKMIHPYWDMALLEVDGLKDGHQPLALLIHSDDQFVGQNIAVVGYPAFDPRNPADVQNRVFGGKYNVKRLLPGKGDHRRGIDSFGNSVSALVHDASTLA
jgi:endonuclease G, mitochondrial